MVKCIIYAYEIGRLLIKIKKKSLFHPQSINIPFHLDNKHRRHIAVLTLTKKKIDNLVTEIIPKVVKFGLGSDCMSSKNPLYSLVSTQYTVALESMNSKLLQMQKVLYCLYLF